MEPLSGSSSKEQQNPLLLSPALKGHLFTCLLAREQGLWRGGVWDRQTPEGRRPLGLKAGLTGHRVQDSSEKAMTGRETDADIVRVGEESVRLACALEWGQTPADRGGEVGWP